MSKKTLIILRHAKAEAHEVAGEDHARPLAEKGVLQAQNLGKYMAAQQIVPGRVWCSTAVRTQQTWQYVQQASGFETPVEYKDALYHVSLPQMLSRLQSAPEDVQSLLWIGHNPTLHEICLHFAEGDESDNTHRLMMKFPPCSLAEFTFEGDWAEIDSVPKKFTRFIVPGDL